MFRTLDRNCNGNPKRNIMGSEYRFALLIGLTQKGKDDMPSLGEVFSLGKSGMHWSYSATKAPVRGTFNRPCLPAFLLGSRTLLVLLVPAIIARMTA